MGGADLRGGNRRDRAARAQAAYRGLLQQVPALSTRDADAARLFLVRLDQVADRKQVRLPHDGDDGRATTGASSHIGVLRFISEYGLKAKPVATGDVPSTITQVMSGQVDIGWSVAPFVLDILSTRADRMIARASDIAAISEHTIRVQIINAPNLAAKKD